MSEGKKTPLLPEEPQEPPPAYEDAANGQAPLPMRKGPSSPSGPQIPRGPFPLDIPVLKQLRGRRIILASASPRRRQILTTIFPKIEVRPSSFPENLDKEQLGPFEYVLQTATQKCLNVYQDVLSNPSSSIPDPAVVIAGDTIIVTTTGQILEKPRNERDHISILKMLRDQQAHKIYTATVAVAPREDARHPGYNLESRVVETKVWFDAEAGDELIEAYVKTREGVDKAGGYGIQGMGSLLIDKVEGDWFNAMGMPLKATLEVVERAVLNQDGDGEVDDDADE